MGGIGSGRHWQFGADTTEGYRSIDVRWLKREGLLASGVSRRITWSRGGEVTGSINVRFEPSRVILDYRQRDHGGEWQAESYPVHLDTTPCHMGGELVPLPCPWVRSPRCCPLRWRNLRVPSLLQAGLPFSARKAGGSRGAASRSYPRQNGLARWHSGRWRLGQTKGNALAHL